MKIKTLSCKEKDDFMKKFEENIEDLLLIAKMKGYSGTIKFNKRSDCFGLKIESRQGRCKLLVNFSSIEKEKDIIKKEKNVYEANMVIDYTDFISSSFSEFKKQNTEEYWEEHHLSNNSKIFGFKSKNIDIVFDIFKEIKNII